MTRVCYYLFHTLYATVTGNVPVRSAERVYGPGEVMVQLDNLACQGDETSLLNCSKHGVNMHKCNSLDVAGVMCGGK